MTNNKLQKETLTDYCTEIINEWINNNPYSNSDDDDLLFDYCLDMVCETFGDDFKDGYIYNIVDDSISEVIKYAEYDARFDEDAKETIYSWTCQWLDEWIEDNYEDNYLESYDQLFEDYMDFIIDGAFLEFTDDIAEENYRPVLDKAIQELKNRDANAISDKDIDEMTADLEEFYECAGFDDYYNRVLKNMSASEISNHWHETFKDCPDYALGF